MIENYESYPPLIVSTYGTHDFEGEDYLAHACLTTDCPSGTCIPTNVEWNSYCTGCTDDTALYSSYNQPCGDDWGLDQCIFDDGSCIYPIPTIEIVQTAYSGPNGEVIHGVVQNEIVTAPVDVNAGFNGDKYFSNLLVTIERSNDNINWDTAVETGSNTGSENEFFLQDYFDNMAFSWPTTAGQEVVTLYYRVYVSGVSASQPQYSDVVSVNILVISPEATFVTPSTDGTSYQSHDSIPIEVDYNGLYTDDAFISEDKMTFRITKPDGGIISTFQYLPIDVHSEWEGSGEQAGYFYCPLDAPFNNTTTYFDNVHIQFDDQGVCDAACINPNTGEAAYCVTYHNIFENLGYRWGYLWNLLWSTDGGEYNIDLEYPTSLYSCDDGSYCGNSSDDYGNCDDGTTECSPSILNSTTINLTINTGCIDATTNGVDGACNCVSCNGAHDCCVGATLSLCNSDSDCGGTESCVPSPIGNVCQPTSCFAEGFYNPKASVGFCTDLSGADYVDEGKECHDESDCNSSDGTTIGCLCANHEGIGGECITSCQYPVLGCTDNGES